MITEIINDDSGYNEHIFYDESGKLTEYKKEHKIVHLKDNKVNEQVTQVIPSIIKNAKAQKSNYKFEFIGTLEAKLSTTNLYSFDLKISDEAHPEDKPIMIPFRDLITEQQLEDLKKSI